jgi:hypothetical protein
VLDGAGTAWLRLPYFPVIESAIRPRSLTLSPSAAAQARIWAESGRLFLARVAVLAALPMRIVPPFLWLALQGLAVLRIGRP